MAARKLASRLILITPFTSMNSVVVFYGAPVFMLPLINDQLFDNYKKAASIECPVLIVSGEKDNVIPHRMSLDLKEAFADSTIIVLQTNKHQNVYEDFTPVVWKQIGDFIR
jgi:fermentation-respiration switch protein FrsA (DUF1100 family)